MIESMPLWLINLGTWMIETAQWWTTGIFGICVYWLPVIILLIHYTKTAIVEIQEDREAVMDFNVKLEAWELNFMNWAVKPENRNQENCGAHKPQYTRQHTTIGAILARALVAFVPCVNLFLALFDALGELLTSIGNRIRLLFNINVVPKPNE